MLAKRSRRQQAIKIKLEELEAKREQAVLDCRGCERRLEGMNYLVRLFAGPALKNRIQALQNNREALEERIREFRDIIERIEGEPLPEPDGLSLESRRLINIAVISLAQHLVLHFEANDLARLARKASRRSVGDMKFGERAICDGLVERVRERINDLNRDKTLADQVKTRADSLVNRLSYRHETDSVPLSAGLGDIERRGPSGKAVGAALRVNVLEDDFWELAANLY